MRIGELEFTELPLKLTLYPENVYIPIVPNRITTVILESRINSAVNIGNFITMISDPSSRLPNLQSILFSDDGGDIMCMLPLANISLFDTHITTGVQIVEEGLQFTSSSLHLFDIGTARVTGRGGTDRPWDSLKLRIRVQLLNEFTNDLTRHLNTELMNDIKEALQHIDSANNTYISVAKRVSELQKKIMKLQNQQDNIQRSYDTNWKRKGDLEKKRDQHKAIFNRLLETYWNATDELQGSIESICQIKECDFTCTPGIVQNYCYVPVSMTVKKTCSYYEQAISKVHKLDGIKRTICSYEKSTTTTSSIPSVIGRIISIVTGSPIPGLIGMFVSLLTTTKKKLTCQPVTVTDNEWVTVTQLATILKQRQCNILTVKEYNTDSCSYHSACAVYKSDPVCGARNEECYDNRTKIVKSFYKNNDLPQDIDMRHDHYRTTLNDLIDLSSEIAILKLQNISASEEIEATSLKIQSSLESAQVANASLHSIIASNSRIREVNNVLNDINSIIIITDVSFDILLETQTPVIIPLKVLYEIIQLKTSHQVRITVDISANKDLIMKTIYDNIYEDIIDNVIGASSSRRRRNVIKNGTITLVDIFKDNCDLQSSIINYLDQLNQSLSAVQNDITNAVTTINITKDNETANHIASVEALRSVGTNLSLALLIKERKIYATQMEEFDLVVSEITDTKLSQWRTDLDELHNQTSDLFGQTCHNLVDCLSTSVNNIRKLVSSLKVFNTSEMIQRIKDTQYTIQELNNNTSWMVDDMQYTVSKVYQLALDVAENGYWCATPPVLLDQPSSHIEKFVGNSLTLTCPSSSHLPVTYSWYKDHKTIPFAISSSLSIPFLTRADAGLYQCEVRNAVGITKSKPTILKVYRRVTITQEPESVTVVGEDNAYFICRADGYPLPYYQWLYRRSDDDAWSAISGEQEGLLNINNASYNNEGQYRCKAINNYSAVYSKPALLTVLPGTYSKLSYNYTISFDIATPIVVQSLKDAFMRAVGDIININITPVHVTSILITNNQAIISFTLFSSNYSIQRNAESSEAWLNQTIVDLGQVQASKTALDSSLCNTTHPFTIRTSSSDVHQANGKTVISSLVFDCPNGYQFDTSRLLCGKSLTASLYLILLL